MPASPPAQCLGFLHRFLDTGSLAPHQPEEAFSVNLTQQLTLLTCPFSASVFHTGLRYLSIYQQSHPPLGYRLFNSKGYGQSNEPCHPDHTVSRAPHTDTTNPTKSLEVQEDLPSHQELILSAGCLNSVPNVCTTNTSPNKPSPRLPSYRFHKKS